MRALGLVWNDVDPLARDFEEISTPLREPVHCGARLLFSAWREKQAQGGFQFRRDLPSRPLATTLRNVAVYEPVEGDFRVRLAGSALLRRFGRDITGCNLSTLFCAEDFKRRRTALANMLESGKPFSADMTFRKQRRDSLRYEFLGLPVLSETGARWALTGIFFHDWAG